MAIRKGYRDIGYFAEANTNAKKVVSNLTARLRRLDKYGEQVLEQVCKLFVQKAQIRLLNSGYNVKNLVNNIHYRKYGNGKYRVGIRNNKQKEIMYFLEFGTGIVGLMHPHEKADDIGWEYIMYPENLVSNNPDFKNPIKSSGRNSLGEEVGTDGWYYYDPVDNSLQFTSGLKAVSYIYDTMRDDMKDIIREAKEMVLSNG